MTCIINQWCQIWTHCINKLKWSSNCSAISICLVSYSFLCYATRPKGSMGRNHQKSKRRTSFTEFVSYLLLFPFLKMRKHTFVDSLAIQLAGQLSLYLRKCLPLYKSVIFFSLIFSIILSSSKVNSDTLADGCL